MPKHKMKARPNAYGTDFASGASDLASLWRMYHRATKAGARRTAEQLLRQIESMKLHMELQESLEEAN